MHRIYAAAFSLILLAVAGCDSGGGSGDLFEEPKPFIENGVVCADTESYWACRSDSGNQLDFAAYEGFFELLPDSSGGGILIMRAADTCDCGNETSETFDYRKPGNSRVDVVLDDGSHMSFRHVTGSIGDGVLSFAIDGGPFSGESLTCDLVDGEFLDGDCDGEPGGERTPGVSCEIPIPSTTAVFSVCTPTPSVGSSS